MLIVSLVIFLFLLFTFTKDDFFLFRKNVTVETIFNIFFLTVFIGLFTARLFYVLFHFRPVFVNPLVFLLFFYFPGLSISGGVLGGLLFLLYYTNREKLPKDRLLDFFALSLLGVFPISLIVYEVFLKLPLLIVIATSVISACTFFFMLFLLRSKQVKEGSVGWLSLSAFGLFLLLMTRVENMVQKKPLFHIEDILTVCLILIGIGFFFKRERFTSESRKFRRRAL